MGPLSPFSLIDDSIADERSTPATSPKSNNKGKDFKKDGA